MFKESVPQLQRWLQTTLDNTQRFPMYRLRALLLFGASLAGLNSLLYLTDPQSDLYHLSNLLAIATFALLWLIATVFQAVQLSSHLFVLTCFVFLSVISLLSGGINSPNIAWMPLVPIVALMVFGWRWCVAWLMLVLLGFYVQYVAVDLDWIDGMVSPDNFPIEIALGSRLNVLFMLLLSVWLYDWILGLKRKEMAQHNAQLERTQTALLEAQTHKDEFIASVGHELRTPMNAILGLNGVLLSELRDHPPQHGIAQHIRDSTEQLLRVVNDILDISQLEATGVTFHPAPCQLRAVVQACSERLHHSVMAKNLTLHCHVDEEIPHWVMLDQRRLEQVLHHLLDNAIKFTNEGGVSLRLGITTDHLRFEIEDSGIGIPNERLHNVFSRFEHADLDTHRIYGGTGLGLAICERLVSRQEGRIGLASVQNNGTQVWFELPLLVAQTPLTATHTPHMNLHRRFKVLLVDDNAMNLLVAELMLKTAWHEAEVYKVNSGMAALKLLSAQAVDLVLMDMVMPEMDGLQTTVQLRQMPGLAQLPVIGLTANSQSQDIVKCLAAGMNDVLMKPIDAKLLNDCIERHLSKADHV